MVAPTLLDILQKEKLYISGGKLRFIAPEMKLLGHVDEVISLWREQTTNTGVRYGSRQPTQRREVNTATAGFNRNYERRDAGACGHTKCTKQNSTRARRTV